MSNYLVKGHHSIMRTTAVADFNAVLNYCKDNGLPIFYPKGASWQKVEDATALMLKNINNFSGYLNRGVTYYQSL